jgi:hypothetical protein
MRDYIFVFRPSEIGDYQTCVGLEAKHAHAATVSKWRRRAKYLLTLLRMVY